MKSKMLHDAQGARTFAIVFDKNDAVGENLLEFADADRFEDAYIHAIGAFSEMKLGFFDRQQKTYKPIPIDERVEVLAFAVVLQATLVDAPTALAPAPD